MFNVGLVSFYENVNADFVKKIGHSSILRFSLKMIL